MMSSLGKLEITILVGYALLLMLLIGCGSDEKTETPAALPWIVDETKVSSVVYPPESTPVVFLANLMRYTYYSRITYDRETSTFVEQGEFDITEYRNGFVPGGNPGYVVSSAMSAGYYHLIGDFRITGPVTPTGATIEEGTINLYIDLTPDNSSRDKDVLIGSAVHLFSGGAGAPDNPDAIGSFEAVYDDFKLTSEGTDYCKAPQPFYVNLDFYGDVLTSEPDPDDPNSYDTTGAGGAYFPASVPDSEITSSE
ncbi:MAG: hypothetical protein R6X27_15610 [Candidatus Desulfacyla sp.]